MSTSQNKYQQFMSAKADFLERARTVPVMEGFLYSLSALDSPLVCHNHYDYLPI
jgi:hypothetical protein